MEYKRHIKILPYASWIARRGDLQDRLMSKPERARITSVLEQHEAIHDQAAKTPSPAQSLREFNQEFGGIGIPGSGQRWVQMCKAIVAAAQLDPNAEFALQAAINANVERELPLIKEIFSNRLPHLVAEIFDAAAEDAKDFLSLVGLTAEELRERVGETVKHIGDRLAEAEKSTDLAAWLEELRTIGLEV